MGSTKKTLGVSKDEHATFTDVQEKWEDQGGLLSRLLIAVDPDELEQVRWETRDMSREELAAAAAEKHNVGQEEDNQHEQQAAADGGVVTRR